MAFITPAPLGATSTTPSSTASRSCARACGPVMSLSRRDVLQQAALAAAAVILGPSAASAANGQGLERAFSKVLFPKEGFNAPSDAPPPSIDSTILATPKAKAALEKIKTYQSAISDLYAKFEADPQNLELTTTVRNLISISELRTALNVVNEAVNEEAQIESDKIVRGIIQDIGELETAASVKKGSIRSPKKITRTADWFDKLETDFKQLLAFYG